jgi:hypothetical protein
LESKGSETESKVSESNVRNHPRIILSVLSMIRLKRIVANTHTYSHIYEHLHFFLIRIFSTNNGKGYSSCLQNMQRSLLPRRTFAMNAAIRTQHDHRSKNSIITVVVTTSILILIPTTIVFVAHVCYTLILYKDDTSSSCNVTKVASVTVPSCRWKGTGSCYFLPVVYFVSQRVR